MLGYNTNGALTEILQGIKRLIKLREQIRQEYWTNYPNHSRKYTYYNSVTAYNPSGNKNIYKIEYIKDDAVEFTVYYGYDADDDVILETNTPI